MGCMPSKKKSESYDLAPVPDGAKAGDRTTGPSESKKPKRSNEAERVRNGSSGAEIAGDTVEVTVCPEDEMKNGEMRQVSVNDAPVLLVKDKDQFFAVSGKCTHYGASLAKGSYCNGIVRCPWHGACFNVKTGDIEDFPGLDSLQQYKADVVNGQVRILASKASLSTSKRKKTLTRCTDHSDQNSVVIIGSGAAGLSCAETLRQEGFSGRIIMLGKETALPYDRPKLSKAADIPEKSIYLRPQEFYEEADIEVLTGKEVTDVDTNRKIVYFEGGEMPYGSLVIATGGNPRTFTCSGSELRNICYLRTPSEARQIHTASVGKNVVIIGSSFIGMEEAACLAKKALNVVIVGTSSVPFEQILGREIGQAIDDLYEEKGIRMYNNRRVVEFVGHNGAVCGVVLDDSTTLQADVVVGGIGVTPSTSFIRNSGIHMDDKGFVHVNEKMETNIPGVYACGDIVAFPLLTFGGRRKNVQHWQMALKHGRTAAINIVGQRSENCHSVPFFWSVLFGKSLRYCGSGEGYGDTIIHGDLKALKFVCYYLKNGIVIAVVSLNRDPTVAQIADIMRIGKSITREDVLANVEDTWDSFLASDTTEGELRFTIT